MEVPHIRKRGEEENRAEVAHESTLISLKKEETEKGGGEEDHQPLGSLLEGVWETAREGDDNPKKTKEPEEPSGLPQPKLREAELN